jgi:hypothetical protein
MRGVGVRWATAIYGKVDEMVVELRVCEGVRCISNCTKFGNY